jgi:NADH:ubiquinone oxidoreductase subunit
VQHLQVDPDPQRQLLQVRELQHDVRLRLTSFPEGPRPKESGLRAGQGKRPSCKGHQENTSSCPFDVSGRSFRNECRWHSALQMAP